MGVGRRAHRCVRPSPQGVVPAPQEHDLLAKRDQVADDRQVEPLHVASKLFGREHGRRRGLEVEAALLHGRDLQVVDLDVPAPQHRVEHIIGQAGREVRRGRDGAFGWGWRGSCWSRTRTRWEHRRYSSLTEPGR